MTSRPPTPDEAAHIALDALLTCGDDTAALTLLGALLRARGTTADAFRVAEPWLGTASLVGRVWARWRSFRPALGLGLVAEIEHLPAVGFVARIPLDPDGPQTYPDLETAQRETDGRLRARGWALLGGEPTP